MRFGTCFEERIYLPGSASDSATSGSTGKVRHKAQRSGLGTKGEVRLRIIWVKDWVVSFVSLTEEVAAAILAVRETLAGL